MNLTGFALRRPVSLIVTLIALVLASLFGLKRMQRDIFPSLGVPTIYVAQPYGGMSPAQMEGFLSYFYEYHFLYITGIEHVESKSVQGASILKLQFYPGTDMSAAMAETVSYVNRSRAFMPPGTVPPFVTRFDAGSVPVGNLVFSSDKRSVGELQDFALNKVRPMFATLPGVSAPPPFGGSARTIVVNADPDKLRARHISPDELVSAVANANAVSPAGNITTADSYPMVPVNSIVTNVSELTRVPVRAGVNPPVLIGDVASVSDGSDIVTSYALVNGRRTVYIPVTKRADASTMAVVESVKANMAKFQTVLPDDVKVSYEFDQSPYVSNAIANVWHEGLLGAVFTGLMVMLFLRDWRSALIIVINIPLSLLGALLALWLTGQTVNLMTLGGLALAVGVLVDEATVTVENIHSHLERGATSARAAFDATRETASARLLAMLCVVAVFLPSFLMEGAARSLFAPLAMAAGFSMAASYLLSSTLVPVLSARWLKGHEHTPSGDAAAGFFARVRIRFDKVSSTLIKLRIPLILGYALAMAALIVVLEPRLGVEIFPRAEETQLRIAMRAPSGTKVETTEARTRKALEIIGKEAGENNVALTMCLVGIHASNYPINFIYQWNGGPEESVIQVQLKHAVDAGFNDRLRSRFAREMPDSSFSFEPADIISRIMSFGANTPVEIAVSGPELAVDAEFADKIKKRLEGIHGLRDIRFGQTLDYPTINVTVDRERAGLLGVKTTDVARSLVAGTSSSRFTQPVYWADPKSGVAYQVQVQIPQTAMNSAEAVRNIPVVSSKGATPLVRDVAKVEPGVTVGQYERYNMRRLVSITATVENVDLGSVSKAVSKAIADAGEPPRGVNVDVRGLIAPMDTLLTSLRGGLLLAMVVIFLLLTAAFRSPILSLVVVASVPAAIAGAGLLLFATGCTLNVQSYMGLIMTIGVAVANAILLVGFAEKARMTGAPADVAARDAVVGRLRPILMTSAAMIAGMIPMALGLGESGGQSAPLARAVIGGIALATLATLLVLPAVFAVARRNAGRSHGSLHPDDHADGSPHHAA